MPARCLIAVLALHAIACAFQEPKQPPAQPAPPSREELEKAAANGDAEGQYQLGLLASPPGRGVDLGREHIPFLETLLGPGDWSLNEAAISQLIRLDREKYLPKVREYRENLSPEFVKRILEPADK